MQAQLDYAEQAGEYWGYVSELLTGAMGEDGQLLSNSKLVELLQSQESWTSMSEEAKKVWMEDLTIFIAR